MQLLDIGGDMHALDRRELSYPSRGKPIEEFDGGARIGAARVRIADIGGEEFKEAIRRALADGGDEGRGAVGEDDKLGHNRRPGFKIVENLQELGEGSGQ